MFPSNPSDASGAIGGLAIFGLVIAMFWRLIVWVREAPVRPDPWDKEIAEKVADPEIVQTCTHCSTEQPPDGWFCPHCGAAVGPYINWMPYVHIFSIGEVLRNGSSGRVRSSPMIIIGYVLYALLQYTIAVPLYLFFFFRNLRRTKATEAAESTKPESM